jgi:hypothetical protein
VAALEERDSEAGMRTLRDQAGLTQRVPKWPWVDLDQVRWGWDEVVGVVVHLHQDNTEEATVVVVAVEVGAIEADLRLLDPGTTWEEVVVTTTVEVVDIMVEVVAGIMVEVVAEQAPVAIGNDTGLPVQIVVTVVVAAVADVDTKVCTDYHIVMNYCHYLRHHLRHCLLLAP